MSLAKKLYSSALSLLLVTLPLSGLANITLSEVSAPNFGKIKAGTAGRVLLLNLSNGINSSNDDGVFGATTGSYQVGVSQPGDLITVSASAISSGSTAANIKVFCSYENSPSTRCDNAAPEFTSVSLGVLKVSIEFTTNSQTYDNDTDTISFLIDVSYSSP